MLYKNQIDNFSINDFLLEKFGKKNYLWQQLYIPNYNQCPKCNQKFNVDYSVCPYCTTKSETIFLIQKSISIGIACCYKNDNNLYYKVSFCNPKDKYNKLAGFLMLFTSGIPIDFNPIIQIDNKLFHFRELSHNEHIKLLLQKSFYMKHKSLYNDDDIKLNSILIKLPKFNKQKVKSFYKFVERCHKYFKI